MPLRDDTQLRLIQSIQDVRDMVKWFEGLETNVLGLDTETSGLKIYQPDFKLRMIQIGDDHNGWAVPFHNWGGSVLELMREWDAKNGQWTLHNIAYDWKVLKVMAEYEIPWRNAHDTMIMSRILYPAERAGLKDVTDKYIDPRASMGEKALTEAFKNNGWTWATIPIDQKDYAFYSALDPVLARAIFDVFYPQVMETPGVYDLEMSALRVLVGAEDRGMRIDLDYAKRKSEELSNTVLSKEKYAEEHWGININSNPQLLTKFTEMGAKFSVFTPKGDPSVNKVQLDRFMQSSNEEVAELSKFVVETRSLAKMNSSYFMNFISMEQDGVLHPNINTMAARTGRMSVTDPALQTLHSSDSVIRNTFLPRNDGEVLVSCDYSQVEARLLAHLSGDENLIRAFKEADSTGGDFFVEVGKLVYSDPHFKKSDPRRKLMKGLIYGSSYGAGIDKMAQTAGVPKAEMEVAANHLFTAFPGIKSYMAELERRGEQTEKETGVGYVELASGRKLVADEGKMYTLTNYSIQGLAAELLKIAFMRIEMAGLSEYVQIPVHDEIIFSLPEDNYEERFFPLIQECMSFTDGEFAVDLLAIPERIGYRWGEGYDKVPDKFFGLLAEGERDGDDNTALDRGEDNPMSLNTADGVRHKGFNDLDGTWLEADYYVNYRGVDVFVQYDTQEWQEDLSEPHMEQTKRLLAHGVVVRVRESSDSDHQNVLLPVEDDNLLQVVARRGNKEDYIRVSKTIREYLDAKADENDD